MRYPGAIVKAHVKVFAKESIGNTKHLHKCEVVIEDRQHVAELLRAFDGFEESKSLSGYVPFIPIMELAITYSNGAIRTIGTNLLYWKCDDLENGVDGAEVLRVLEAQIRLQHGDKYEDVIRVLRNLQEHPEP